MSPRKRQRTNPSEPSSSNPPAAIAPAIPTSATSQVTAVSEPVKRPVRDMPISRDRSGSETQNTAQNTQKQVRKTRSWYGSWPRAPKSSASTQLARETIFGGTLKPSNTPDFRRFDTKRSIDSASVDDPTQSSVSLPQIPEGDAQTPEDNTATTSSKPNINATAKGNSPAVTNETIQETTQDDPDNNKVPEEPHTTQQPASRASWFGWLGSAPLTETQTFAPADEPHKEEEPPKEPQVEDVPVAQPPAPPEAPEAPVEPSPAPATSWFGFWYSGASAIEPPKASEDEMAKSDEVPKSRDSEQPSPERPEDVATKDATPPNEDVSKDAPKTPLAGSTWAFWSRDTRAKTEGAKATPSHPESGELAVIGQGSEAHPERTSGVGVEHDQNSSAGKDSKDTKSIKSSKSGPASAPSILGKKSKRIRPQSMEIDVPSRPETPTRPESVASSKVSITDSVQKEPPLKPGTPKITNQQTPTKSGPSNLLLPSFNSTYRMKDNPSIIKQITSLLLRAEEAPANHVYKVKETPRIKKAIAIGVHGLFPASYLRPMVGQPTGTSLRFASLCAEGIARWTDAHGCSDCEIEKIALEGEGKIGDRVDNLWKLLLNWIDTIRNADLIVLACHSQGVPVGVMLLAKLIGLGIITNAKIGVCAMAGVSLGPFPDYKSSMGILMGSANELWDFSNPESEISKKYEHALKEVLQYGVRITYVGSIDDQLVPMESAIYSPASHPYIYRAVFIDGRIHAPDFIAHLVGFALKLRNMGISDHGLIRELSTPLAGSLYSGEGHSRLYYDPQVYDLALMHALETSDVKPNVPATITPRSSSLANPNPYHLPWIMRGLLEEDYVRTELSAETEELLRQFDDWKPVTKALKDVKYRLEAIRSKL
ncbi:Uncharacterized protein CTRI78_v011514 [Colletotrichum trifolii]|uniref:YMC020W-like alpha/beta hydrolase domain-containing protein n=1 Tax=Colletotrichum trifolii TaxID=5466 RepID=A0A4V3HSF3_COLTR|nr:Uncharacterized protein CTRI78_v011514 [Colletotrichum trifolii]